MPNNISRTLIQNYGWTGRKSDIFRVTVGWVGQWVARINGQDAEEWWKAWTLATEFSVWKRKLRFYPVWFAVSRSTDVKLWWKFTRVCTKGQPSSHWHVNAWPWPNVLKKRTLTWSLRWMTFNPAFDPRSKSGPQACWKGHTSPLEITCILDFGKAIQYPHIFTFLFAMSFTSKEVLPPPIKAKPGKSRKSKHQAKTEKETKPKHKVVIGPDLLAFNEGGDYVPYGDNTKPSQTELLKRVRNWKKSKTTKKKRCSFKVGTTAYALTYDPLYEELMQTNLASSYTRVVKVLPDVTVSPPLPFFGQTHFPMIPLPDLHKVLTATNVGGPLPKLMSACFSHSRSIPLVVKDVVEVGELDRLKKDYCIGLHGTSNSAAQRIIRNGFDMRRLGQRGSFHGKGIYITSCLPTARFYGKHVLVVAFHTNPKPHLFYHGNLGLDTAVVRHARNVLPLMWISE